MNTDALLSLITAFFLSWQVKTLGGLIVLDVLLGIASALRRGVFDWAQLANFYRTMVMPYIIGYLALWLAVGFIIPPEALGPGLDFNEAAVTTAWAVLVATLGSSIAGNFTGLYRDKG
jgi:hypothetical protein